jgi:hypothetical protein
MKSTNHVGAAIAFLTFTDLIQRTVTFDQVAKLGAQLNDLASRLHPQIRINQSTTGMGLNLKSIKGLIEPTLLIINPTEINNDLPLIFSPDSRWLNHKDIPMEC